MQPLEASLEDILGDEIYLIWELFLLTTFFTGNIICLLDVLFSALALSLCTAFDRLLLESYFLSLWLCLQVIKGGDMHLSFYFEEDLKLS